MNMRKILKQAQEMQDKMQKELGEQFTEASVGGGMVTVKMDGHKNLVSCKIEPDAIDPDDPGMLEDLVVAAINEANRKIDDMLQERLGSMAGGLPNLGL